MLEKIKATANYIKGRINATPEIGIILGTGLGGLVNEIEIIDSIPYSEIPNFPVSTVQGHAGRLIYTQIPGAPDPDLATGIGISCRLCHRANCVARAASPILSVAYHVRTQS